MSKEPTVMVSKGDLKTLLMRAWAGRSRGSEDCLIMCNAPEYEALCRRVNIRPCRGMSLANDYLLDTVTQQRIEIGDWL